MRKYLSLIVETDREVKRGDETIYPKGTDMRYELQYPSLTEAMAHIVYAARNIGRPKAIGVYTTSEGDAFCLPQNGPSLDPIGWIKSGWNASMRGYRVMCAELRKLNLPLLPQWPQEARKEARAYWATRMEMRKRLTNK